MTKRWLVGLCALAAGVAGSGSGRAQSAPTATQGLELSVFGAGTGTYTGLDGGRNAAITAGVDLAFRPFYGFRPALELRGTEPVDKGVIDGQTSGLIGVRVMRTYHRFNPYVDALFGRGAIDYPNGGFIVDNYRYDRTTTNVFAGGGGLDYRLTQHFDVKADIQFERWETPVITSGTIYSKPISLGIVYHLDFNQYSRHREKKVKYRPEPVVAEPVMPPPPPPGAQPPLAGTPVPADAPLPNGGSSSTSAPPPPPPQN